MKDIIKSNIFKMIAALALVGIASGASLVFVYKYSIPKIKVNMDADKNRAIRMLFSKASKIDYDKKSEIYKVEDDTGKSLGYAFIAEGNGYQGAIKLMVAVNTDLTKMLGMEVLESQETPGLGAEIAGDKFKKQFTGLDMSHPVELVKNQTPQEKYQIEAITGATISSRAVVNIINKKTVKIRKLLKQE